MMSSNIIMKSFDCLNCKHCIDWDCDFEENHWFACEYYDTHDEKDYYSGVSECPMFEEDTN